MKALLINPATKTIERVEVDNQQDIAKHIGYETLESDEVGPEGDRMFFDEECFIRGDASAGRFQIDNIVPVAGKAVVIGASQDGSILNNVSGDIDALAERIKYI